MTGYLYQNVPGYQEELIGALTERYADQRIRFDTGFVGNIPVQACGRIGRHFFYFRFRGDTASLTLGRADHRGSASRHKHGRRKALRKLRRGHTDHWFGGLTTERELRRDRTLDRHPSRPVWYAVISGVTGERYAGHLEDVEAAELFIELMGRLQPAGPEPKYGKLRKLVRGSWTPAPGWSKGVICKNPARRRR